MKKFIIFFTLIVTILLISATCVFATNIQNDAMKATDSVRNVVGGAENVVEDTAKNGTNDIKNGINTVGTDGATTNSANYGVTRTATEDAGTNVSNGLMNSAWTWIIVAIIAIVIIAVIWYYSTRSNDRD